MKKPPHKSKKALLGPPRPPVAPAVLRVAECARRLGVSAQHILNFIEEGKLAAIDVGLGSRHHYRIPVEAFEDFRKRATA